MAKQPINDIQGQVVFDKSIVLSVINLAAKEITGVSSLAANFGSLTSKLFGNKNNGLKIFYTQDNKLEINIYLNVYFGNNVSLVASRVQENIKNTLSSMLNLEISKINVHVLGVEFNKEKQNILKPQEA